MAQATMEELLAAQLRARQAGQQMMQPQGATMQDLLASQSRARGARDQLMPPEGDIRQGMVEGMSPAYDNQEGLAAAAGQDFSGRDAQLNSQRAAAQRMLESAGESPGLIQAGNISVAGANPLTALAAGIRGYTGAKALRDANAAQTDLEGERGVAAEAAAVLAQQEKAQEQANKDRSFGHQSATLQNTIRQQKAAADTSKAARDTLTLVDPTDPDSAPRAARVDAEGNRTWEDGTAVPDNNVDWNTFIDNKRQELSAIGVDTEKGLTRKVEKADMHLQRYGKDLDKSLLPRVQKDIAYVDELLGKLEDAEGNISNIPGTGGAMNLPGALGGAAAAAADFFTGDDAPVSNVDFRTARTRLANTEIRTQSGAAVTLPEMMRNATGLGLEIWSDDKAFMKVWPQIKDVIAEERGNFDNAYGPEVTEIYNRREAGERLTTREYFEEQPAPKNRPTADYSEEDLENMSDEELEEYISRGN